jgi:broad specificity phosphatase PhoE
MSQPGPDVTIIRHGETTWSANGQHTGRTDLPLTDAGEAEAKALAGRIGPFDTVFCSPLTRALRTAELAGLEVTEVTDDLREWDYGDFEGLTTPEITARQPGWTIWDGPWPGGEDVEQVADRCDRVVSAVRACGPDERVALVAHGHILRAVTARWLNLDVPVGRHLVLGTGTVSVLGWEHEWPAVRLWNAGPEER